MYITKFTLQHIYIASNPATFKLTIWPQMLQTYQLSLWTHSSQMQNRLLATDKQKNSNVKLDFCIGEAKWPIRPVLISGFCSTKRQRLFLIPPWWDASPSQGYPPPAREHNTMYLVRARTRTARSGDERTNHETTAPPTNSTSRWFCNVMHSVGPVVYLKPWETFGLNQSKSN